MASPSSSRRPARSGGRAEARGITAIWCYTSYLYDDLAGRTDPAIANLLDHIDVLVDGPFVESRKSLELKWCGSSNQRLIDVPATRRAGSVVEWQPASFSLEKSF